METAQGGTVLGNAIRNPHSVVRTAYTLYGRVDRPRTFAKLWLIFWLITAYYGGCGVKCGAERAMRRVHTAGAGSCDR